MPRKIPRPQDDYTGQRFGKLVAVRKSHQQNRVTFWEYACDCGKTKIAPSSLVRNGHIRNCGCVCASPEYACWKGMKARCGNPNSKGFENYGGRGISVCDSWKHSFENFITDVGPAPAPASTIDRIDVNGNYEPGNVRWATKQEQAQSKRTSRFITYNGETLNHSQWGKKTGFGKSTVSSRIRLGWSIERTLTAIPGTEMVPPPKKKAKVHST